MHDDPILRTDPAICEKLLTDGARQMDLTGHVIKGFVLVNDEVLKSRDN